MNRNLADRRAAEARALIAALAIARRAGWTFEAAGPVLSTPFAGYLHVASAQAVLVPTSAGLPFATRLVDQAMREARSDALVVSCTGDAAPTVRLALGLWSPAGTDWVSPVRPWMSEEGALWLGEAGGRCWPLRPCVTVAAPAPWRTEGDRRGGHDRARRWLAELVA